MEKSKAEESSLYKKKEKGKRKNRPKEERIGTILSRKLKKFLCESDWNWRKELAVKLNFATNNVKN